MGDPISAFLAGRQYRQQRDQLAQDAEDRALKQEALRVQLANLKLEGKLRERKAAQDEQMQVVNLLQGTPQADIPPAFAAVPGAGGEPAVGGGDIAPQPTPPGVMPGVGGQPAIAGGGVPTAPPRFAPINVPVGDTTVPVRPQTMQEVLAAQAAAERRAALNKVMFTPQNVKPGESVVVPGFATPDNPTGTIASGGPEQLSPYQRAQMANANARLQEAMRHNKAMEGEGINASSPDAIEAANAMGEFLATTGRLPSGFRVYGKDSAPFYIQMAKHAKQYAEDHGINLPVAAAAFTSNQASLTQLIKSYDSVRAFLNTADKNSVLLEQMLPRIPDVNSPIFNSSLRAFSQQVSGNPDLSQFSTYLRSVQNEYSKILTNPNLTGQLTDAARREAEQLLQPDATVKQIVASLEALRAEGMNRLVSIEDQINSVQQRIRTPGAGGLEPLQSHSTSAPGGFSYQDYLNAKKKKPGGG